MTDDPLQHVTDIRRIHLEPGDTLWVKVDEAATRDQELVGRLRQALGEWLHIDQERILITAGLDMAVVDQESADDQG